MKAFICPEYGPPEVLQLRNIEKPVPADHEVLIKVVATTVASGDCRSRSFDVPQGYAIPARLSMGVTRPKKQILGTELSGEIAAVGRDVTRFREGDLVFAAVTFGPGAHAEYRTLPEDGPLAPKPANMTFEEAAAIPFGGLTALHFLRNKADIQPGQKILINGASGSIGTYAVQIARHYGAEVTGVCSTTNLDLVRSLGAEHVTDYTRHDFTTGDEEYDIIFDAVGKSDFARAQNALKPGGIFLTVEMALANIFTMFRTSVFGEKKLITGVGKETAADLHVLKDLAEAGELTVVIDRRYPFEQIPDAHRYVEQGHKRGNVVIIVADNGRAQASTAKTATTKRSET